MANEEYKESNKYRYVLTNIDSRQQIEIKCMTAIEAAKVNDEQRKNNTRDRWLVWVED